MLMNAFLDQYSSMYKHIFVLESCLFRSSRNRLVNDVCVTVTLMVCNCDFDGV